MRMRELVVGDPDEAGAGARILPAGDGLPFLARAARRTRRRPWSSFRSTKTRIATTTQLMRI